MNIRYGIIISLKQKTYPSVFSFLLYPLPILMIQLCLFSLSLAFSPNVFVFFFFFVSSYVFQTIFFLGVCGWILIVAVVTHTYILIHTHHPIYSSDDIYKYRCLHRHYRQRITHLSKVKHNISTDKIVIQLHQ